jgi:hypothetical protein
MAFNVEEAFGQFASPEQVLEAKRQARRERHLTRTQDMDLSERAASGAGVAFAQAAKSLAGVKDRDVQAAEEMTGAFQKIMQSTRPVAESSDLPEEELQAAMTEEQQRIAETGAFAEAQYIKEGLSEDEARLAAMDDVIAGAKIPEVARELIRMRAQQAAEIREKRGRINVLKAEATTEALDRRVAEAEAAEAEARNEDYGLEYIQLQRYRDDLIRDGEDRQSARVQEIERRMAKLEEIPGQAGAEDKVTARKWDQQAAELGANTENALMQISNIRDLVSEENFAKTTVASLDKVADNFLTEVEAVHTGFGSWMREKLEGHFGDFSQYGEDKAKFEAMASLLTLAQTDALIKGIPSNFDVGLIEKTLAQGIKDPKVFEDIMNQQASSIHAQANNTFWHINRHDSRNAARVNEFYQSRFVEEPRDKTVQKEKQSEQEWLENFDPTTASLDDLIRASELTSPQE